MHLPLFAPFPYSPWVFFFCFFFFFFFDCGSFRNRYPLPWTPSFNFEPKNARLRPLPMSSMVPFRLVRSSLLPLHCWKNTPLSSVPSQVFSCSKSLPLSKISYIPTPATAPSPEVPNLRKEHFNFAHSLHSPLSPKPKLTTTIYYSLGFPPQF